MEEPRCLKCVFCHAVIFFPDLPATKYIKHLQNEHSIVFDTESVIERTLLLQFPELASQYNKPCQALPVHTASQTNPVTILDPPDQSGGRASAPKRERERKEEGEDVQKEAKRRKLDDKTTNGVVASEADERRVEDEDDVLYNGGDASIWEPQVQMNGFHHPGEDEGAEGEHAGDRMYNGGWGGDTKDETAGYLDMAGGDVTQFMSCEFSDSDGVVSIPTDRPAEADKTFDLAGKLPWYHGCLHNCKLCTRQFFERKLLKEHVETAHQVAFDSFLAEHGDCRTIANVHECDICGRGLMHTYRSLEHHMKKCHQLTLSQYYEERGGNIILPRLEITDPVLVENYVKLSRTSFGGRRTKGGKKNEENNWAFQCVFECKICDPSYPFESRRTFFRHITKFHSMKVSEYTNTYGNYILSKVDHVCQICGAVILWDHHAIYQHLKLSHDNFSTAAYHAQYMGSYTESMRKENQRAYNIGKNRPVQNGAQDDWSNECVYECKICSPAITLNASRKMIRHMKRLHNTNLQTYRKQHGRSLLMKTYHVCHVCGSTVLWDKGVLYDHMKRFHDGLTLPDYYKTHLEVTEDSPVDDEGWMNRCRYECKACKEGEAFSCVSRTALLQHLATAHQLTEGGYKAAHGSILTDKTLHSCQICSETFFWDPLCLRPHIERKHKTTCDDYEAKYLRTYREHAENRLEKSHTRVKVDPMNQCKFQCQLCDKPLNNSRDVDRHLKANHQMKKQQYTGNFGPGIVKKVIHSCQICSNEYLYDKYILFLHVKTAHQLSALEYFENYIQNYRTQPAPSSEDSWTNRCVYGCFQCKKSYSQKKSFEQHITRAHNVSISEYKNRNNCYYLKKEFHNCYICDKEVVFDKTSMFSHLQGHNLSLQAYYEANRAKLEGEVDIIPQRGDKWMYRCKFQCSICVIQFDKKDEVVRHVEQEHQLGMSDYEPRHGSVVCKGMLHTCQVCQENVQWDKESLAPHIQSHSGISPDDYRVKYMKNYKENEECASAMDESAHWMNRNNFLCRICDRSFNSRSKMSRHVTRHHKMSERDYSKLHGDSLVTSVYHVCQICATMVLWDYLSLSSHLRDKHKMKLGDYKERHMENYTENPALEGTEKERRKSLSKFRKQQQQQQAGGDSEGAAADDDKKECDDRILQWARGCLFQCNQCQEKIAGEKVYIDHMKSVHGVTLTRNALNHKSKKIFEGFHYCKLCFKNVKWDVEALDKHLEEVHKESVETYFDKFKDVLKMPKFEGAPNNDIPVK